MATIERSPPFDRRCTPGKACPTTTAFNGPLRSPGCDQCCVSAATPAPPWTSRRPVAARPLGPLEPGDLHEPLRADPRPDVAGAGRPDAGIRAGPLLVQREGRPLRGVRRRRTDRHRDALPPRRLRDVRRLRRPPVQPRDARGALQGAERGRGARPDGRAGGRGLRERADDPQRSRDARGGRARLHQARPAGDDSPAARRSG